MKYFNIKSIILGIGIGVIFTSISGMVYSGYGNASMPMSNEKIISEAKKLGMVEASSINTPAATLVPTPQPVTPAPTPTLTPKPTPVPTPTLGPEVIIGVNDGDTAVVVAQKLYDNKLITDKDSFVNLMVETKSAYKMFAKQHRFRVGMSNEDIINELLSR